MNIEQAFKEFQKAQKEAYSKEFMINSSYEAIKFIREERKRQNITQVEFAKRMNKPIGFVKDFECSRVSNPSIERLDEYLRGLGYKLIVKVEKI